MTYERIRFYRQLCTPLMVPTVEGFDAATNAWVAAVVGDGGTVSDPRKQLVEDLILSLRADGLFVKLDRLWLFAAENSQSALRDIIVAAAATAVNSPSFAVDEGYTFGNATDYVNSNYDPSVDGVAYIQDSAHISAYVRVYDTANANATVFGGHGAAQSSMRATVASLQIRFNDFTNAFFSFGTASMLMLNRPASNSRILYRNGINVASDTNVSFAAPDADIYIGMNNAGGPTEPSAHQIAGVTCGGAFDATEAANFTTYINTYMTAVGANVF